MKIDDLNISKLSLKQGNILVLSVDDEVADDVFRSLDLLANDIEKLLGFRVPIIMAQEGVRLGVIDKKELLLIIDDLVEDEYILAKDYFKKHDRCPSCGGNNCERTTGPIFEQMSAPYRIKRNQNKAHCVCGWSGIVHDLVE